MSSFFDAVITEIGLSQQQLDKVFALGKNKEVNVTLLKDKLDKEKLANFVLHLVKRTQACITLLKNASGEIEMTTKEAKLSDAKIMKLQDELIERKSEQIDHFKSLIEEELPNTIKNELKSYSDVVKENAGDPLTIRSIKTAVKEAVKVVQKGNTQDKNIIMFGLPEELNENLEDKVADVLHSIDQKPKFTAVRFGKADEKRPVKVTFERSDMVRVVLKNAKDLKSSEKYGNIYLTSDMSPEERAKKRKLVEEMKNKIKQNPSTKYYIYANKIHSSIEPYVDSSFSAALERIHGQSTGFYH